jgi:addiction module HigA family antidote
MRPPKRIFPPIHPGEILLEEFLRPLELTQYRLAKDISVPQRRISEIVQGKRAISADTALRLARYFDIEPEFWMNLQARHDLRVAQALLGPRLKSEVRRHAA